MLAQGFFFIGLGCMFFSAPLQSDILAAIGVIILATTALYAISTGEGSHTGRRPTQRSFYRR